MERNKEILASTRTLFHTPHTLETHKFCWDREVQERLCQTLPSWLKYPNNTVEKAQLISPTHEC